MFKFSGINKTYLSGLEFMENWVAVEERFEEVKVAEGLNNEPVYNSSHVDCVLDEDR
jgi:hypothetical protein